MSMTNTPNLVVESHTGNHPPKWTRNHYIASACRARVLVSTLFALFFFNIIYLYQNYAWSRLASNPASPHQGALAVVMNDASASGKEYSINEKHANHDKYIVLGLTHHKSGTLQLRCILDVIAEHLGERDVVNKLGRKNVSELVMSRPRKFWFANHNVNLTCTPRTPLDLCNANQVPENCPCIDGQSRCLLLIDSFKTTAGCTFGTNLPPTHLMTTKIIHTIRHPIDVVLSAYRYHTQVPPPEQWLNVRAIIRQGRITEDPSYPQLRDALGLSSVPNYMSYHDFLRSLPPEQGILVEFINSIQGVYDMMREHAAVSAVASGLNIRFEDLSRDYTTTIDGILNSLDLPGLQASTNKRAKLKKKLLACDPNHWSPDKLSTSNHVTSVKPNVDSKELERVLLSHDIIRDHLCRVAVAIGYTDHDDRC